MISKLARNTVLAVALATLASMACADIAEARYSPYELEASSPVPLSEVRILPRAPGAELEAVGTVEAYGKDQSDIEILEQVNGLRPPEPLAFFSPSAQRSADDDASLAMHALKTVAARNGVQALLILESGRAQIKGNVI